MRDTDHAPLTDGSTPAYADHSPAFESSTDASAWIAWVLCWSA